MATFISTVRFTDQGIKDIRSTSKRASAFRSVAAKMDVQVREIFWTLGPFDGLVVFEAPDEEAATALMLHLASFGNVHTQTARAYEADEIQGILDKIPT